MIADGKDGYASLRMCKLLEEIPASRVVLKLMQSYGFTTITSARDGVLRESCPIDRLLEEIDSYEQQKRR
jgi:hypothetical protein